MFFVLISSELDFKTEKQREEGTPKYTTHSVATHVEFSGGDRVH
jgi:hypothetical protein